MDCPKQIRECPNGWTDCNLCAFKQQCHAGTYEPELEENELEVDLGIVISEVTEPVQESTGGTWRGSWHEHVMSLSPDEALKEFYSKHPPNLHHKEPLPLDGGKVHGGGSSNKAKKKPLKKTPEYLKTWGT